MAHANGLFVSIQELSGVKSLDVSDGGGDATIELPNFIENEYTPVIVTRTGDIIKMYVRGELVGQFTSSSVLNYGKIVYAIDKSCKCFDLKILPRAMSQEDILYYINNVLNNNGKEVLPTF